MPANLIVFNKPYGVLCQFSGDRNNLSDFIDEKGFYPAGRLDKDSEGLLILTNDGGLQARISSPRFKMEKTYWVQVEGEISKQAIDWLATGVELKDGMTKPAQARLIACPLGPRIPDIRSRKNVPTSWLELIIREGRNRQVRRMTAAVGYPTLRLYRSSIGPFDLENIAVGDYTMRKVNL